MRYNVIINQEKCKKHGLTAAEGAMMDLFNQLSSWADDEVIDGKTFYHISRNKVIDELPFFFTKADTVYRSFKSLEEKNLIEFMKQKRKDFVRLSRLGKGWNKLGNKSEFQPNSEINPSKLGKISEFENSTSSPGNPQNPSSNSEINPTDNIYNNTNDKRESRARTRAIDFLRLNYGIRFTEEFEIPYKAEIKDFKKFEADFNDTVDQEELFYSAKVLFARLGKYARNWIQNNNRYRNNQNETNYQGRPDLKRIG